METIIETPDYREMYKKVNQAKFELEDELIMTKAILEQQEHQLAENSAMIQKFMKQRKDESLWSLLKRVGKKLQPKFTWTIGK